MRKLLALSALILAMTVALASPADAAPRKKAAPRAASVPASTFAQPDLLTFGAGWFDVNKNNPRRQAADFRAEYRMGFDMLSGIMPRTFNSWREWFQIHPYFGLEATHRGQIYGNFGFLLDFTFGNIVITPSTSVGLYYEGDGKHLGSFVEFRSGIEAGWRFDNQSRLTVAYDHISNAGITSHNPGAETLTLYYSMPTSWVFGR
jgi:lipid A 3-O-deacylase